MDMVIAFSFLLAILLATVALFVSKYLLICHPNEVIVLSGRTRTLTDGHTVGYRIIRGGRALRVPLVEKAARLSLETIPLELTIHNAYSKGGIPLQVEAIANIKIDSTEPTLGNAVERFLGKAHSEIHEIAKDTLEGNLRGVLATLTPEEVNEDRLKFAQTLVEEADQDLKQLGLQLDTLKIQNVSDDAGYLDSLGRRKTAEVISAARQAEAEKTSEAEEAEAIARRRAEVAKAQADQAITTAQIEVDREVKMARAAADAAARRAEAERKAEAEAAEAEAQRLAEVARAEATRKIREAQIASERDVEAHRAQADQVVATERNQLRLKEAELEKEAVVREKEAEVAGRKAEATFEQEMELERIELQKRRLSADVIEPARARKEALELEARGEAAKALEDGRARLVVLREMIAAFESAKGHGEKVFMLHMMPEIVAQLTAAVERVTIDKVSVIDSGGGNGHGGGVGRVVTQLPGAVISLAEQIETATGVDILSRLGRTPEPARPAAAEAAAEANPEASADAA